MREACSVLPRDRAPPRVFRIHLPLILTSHSLPRKTLNLGLFPRVPHVPAHSYARARSDLEPAIVVSADSSDVIFINNGFADVESGACVIEVSRLFLWNEVGVQHDAFSMICCWEIYTWEDMHSGYELSSSPVQESRRCGCGVMGKTSPSA